MDYGLQDKVAIVTGGSIGLGASITDKLLEEGAKVCFTYHRDTEELRNRVQSLKDQYGDRIDALSIDVSIDEDIERLFDHTLEVFGQVDLIVNNAGVWPTSYIKDMTAESFRRTLDINLIAPFLLCKRFINYCIDNGRKGKVVNMVSQAAFYGSTSGHAHYASSKAGLVGFTISLAREVAKYGINVNAVAPGIMETKLVSAIVDDPVRREKYLERIPIGHIATPEEVARIVLFLLGKESDYMTGATLDATGGMLMR
ncbi:MAG: SDR family oxidoreductase [Erysipelotrichaceae bacterium]|nr:SDR family oxidoreductase [Erysipelotrichaceae bacterium]